MNSLMKRSMIVALCLCMLLVTACGSGGDGGDKPMGRYVESRLDYPVEGKSPFLQRQRSDGSIDVYYSDTEGANFQCFNTKDGEKWEEKEIPWKLPAGQFINGLVYDKDDRAYIMTADYSSGSIDNFIYRTEDNGTLTLIPIELKDANGAPAQHTMMEGMEVADNGNILLGQYGSGVGEYKQDGTFVRLYAAGSGKGDSSGFAADGNKLYVIDSGSSVVLAYSLEDGSQLQTITFDNFTRDTYIATGAESAVYLYNRNGIFRMADGGSVWEKLVDGSLTSMIIPSLYFGEFIEGLNGEFYLSGGDGMGSGGQPSQLYKYVYDKTIASLPEKELVVYTLNENASLRQAAGEFQRNHQDTKVNIQVGLDADSAATASDVIRSLNTELLNGKGPDVILLDGMPAESYIEKGVLADLSGILKDMKYDKTMNKVVAETYKNKDGIFAVPSKFSMPVLITDAANAEGLTSLDALAEFAKTHEDKPLIGDKSPENLMNSLLASCAPAWIKGDQIDENGLKDFLERIKEIADTSSPSYEVKPEDNGRSGNFGAGGGGGGVSLSVVSTGGGNSSDSGLFHWAFGRAHALIADIAGSNHLSGMFLGIRKEGNAVILPLPGQAQNVYVPMETIGIHAKSKEMDKAKDFVKLLLSDSVQEKTMDRSGMPVSLAAFDAYISEQDLDVYMGIGGSDYDENESLDGGMPTPEEKEPLRKLYESAKTPYKTDDTLAEMILNEAQGYFTGEKGIAKTILDIQEATKLYLSE